MRLLDTFTGEFYWVNNPSEERYAILSHVWSSDGEQSFQDLADIQKSTHSLASSGAREQRGLYRTTLHWIRLRAVKEKTHLRSPEPPTIFSNPCLSDKIRRACAIARADGYRYIWIDSCCIDKSSSAELSEAINSMYKWYRWATVCYAYLADVYDYDDPLSATSQFRHSRWHTRGWTLQELIAPDCVIFLSKDWHPLGTKNSLAAVVEEATGVDRAVLQDPTSVYVVSVARRMWWASQRKTTRVEDEAYSLMGIFGVHMPTIYGEGRSAFIRLQQEILRTVPDQSIFAWGGSIASVGEETPTPTPLEPGAYVPRVELQLLATSAKHFAFSSHVKTLSHGDLVARLGLPPDTSTPVYTTTSYGIRTSLPLILRPSIRVKRPDGDPWLYEPDYVAILACQDDQSRFITLPLCRSVAAESHNEYVIAVSPGILFPARLWPVSGSDLTLYEQTVTVKEILIRGGLPDPRTSNARMVHLRDRSSDEVILHNWSRSLLSKHGYSVTQEEKHEHPSPHMHTFVVCHSHTGRRIMISVSTFKGTITPHVAISHRDPASSDDVEAPSGSGSQAILTALFDPSKSSVGDPNCQRATYQLDDIAGSGYVQYVHVTVAKFLDDDKRFKYGVEIVIHRHYAQNTLTSQSIFTYGSGGGGGRRRLPFAGRSSRR